MITKRQLDAALESWEVARDRALLEQKAWATLTQSHSTIINSLRLHGHAWSQAQTEFEKLSDGHREALAKAWSDMDLKCKEYQALFAKSKSQNCDRI